MEVKTKVLSLPCICEKTVLHNINSFTLQSQFYTGKMGFTGVKVKVKVGFTIFIYTDVFCRLKQLPPDHRA